MRDAFFEFLKAPSPERYATIRKQLIESPEYDPYSADIRELDSLFNQRKMEELRAAVAASMLRVVLTPRVHFYASVAQEGCGNQEAARFEAHAWRCCIDGLLSTGDGSRERPIFVTRVEDEYDVLEFKKLKPVSQAFLEIKSGFLDVIHCEDGTQVHFDVTDPHRRLMRRMQERRAASKTDD